MWWNRLQIYNQGHDWRRQDRRHSTEDIKMIDARAAAPSMTTRRYTRARQDGATRNWTARCGHCRLLMETARESAGTGWRFKGAMPTSSVPRDGGRPRHGLLHCGRGSKVRRSGSIRATLLPEKLHIGSDFSCCHRAGSKSDGVNGTRNGLTMMAMARDKQIKASGAVTQVQSARAATSSNAKSRQSAITGKS